ncbi:alpha/beta hydrolase [Belnapia sp. T6]|uniref:Alpha/beta hydrolase n=1 Tax=Belnapia mucosa TaxID=2804532 RepID=A0ABS1UX56_9PROT|nr:alpha/beta hydrolase [Belnapia mucosa]MBL6453897.1 alpha/beta hydrolase [Belnapia mucosa]
MVPPCCPDRSPSPALSSNEFRRAIDRISRSLALALLLLLGGCSGADLLNGLASAGGVRVERNVPYTDRLTLDLYEPEEPALDAPVLVFLHGGGWDSGSPADYRFLGTVLARRGVRVAIPAYRLWPEAGYPAFLEDSARAVRWVRDRAPGARLFLMGHSAGAYIAAMLALDGRWLGAVGLQPGRDLAGAIGLSGPYDFLPLTGKRLQAIFGPEVGWPDTQPINHVGPGAPPMLLATGLDDDTVRPANTARLAAALRAAGHRVEEHYYPQVGHVMTIGAFAGLLRPVAPVRAEVLRFLGLAED